MAGAFLDALRRETALSLGETYAGFAKRAQAVREKFWDFLGSNWRNGNSICGYGAAAKGNTFLNYCKLDHRDIGAVADTTPAKIGKFLPGSHIPIISEERLIEYRPEHVVIL